MTSESESIELLQRIVRLLTILVTRDLNQKDKIILLSNAGLQPKEIADLIDTSPNTVSVTLSSIRKGDKRGKRGKPSSKR